MSDLFILLFLASALLLIIGLIKPSIFQNKYLGGKKFTRKQIALYMGILTFVLLLLGGATAETSPEESGTTQEQGVEDLSSLSEEDQIKAIVSQQLEGKNNLDNDYFRSVEVVEQANGGWGVFVEYNAGDNLTTSLKKTGIEKTMSEVYIALYTSDLDIRTASVAAYFPVVDQYGNESEAIVYKSVLEKEEADKVNWDIDGSYLQLEILPGVWSTTLLHPDFR
jgi:hypothetical protein